MPSSILGPFSQLLPMTEMSMKGPLQDSNLSVLSEAGIVIENGLVSRIGRFEDLISDHKNIQVTELPKGLIGLPGFVDCHTHICFAGTRARDFEMRNAGRSYLDIAKAGGGIWDSVTQTRAATEQHLTDLITTRVARHLSKGITTIEIKSGYGLNIEDEVKMLRAIKKASTKTPADLITTCLAAHIRPKDFLGSHSQYLKVIAEQLFPILQREKLTNRIDAFIEEEAFSEEVVAPYFTAARLLGFNITVHADQFSIGGTAVAVKHKALSADHLEASGEKEINLIAGSETVAVALPGASIGLGSDFTPARAILDAGGCLAIASDWNPGSAPMGDLLTQASILATYQKLTTAEVLAGLTFRAAKALNLSDRGVLAEGKRADVVLFEAENYNEILYHQGQLQPSKVVVGGQMVAT